MLLFGVEHYVFKRITWLNAIADVQLMACGWRYSDKENEISDLGLKICNLMICDWKFAVYDWRMTICDRQLFVINDRWFRNCDQRLAIANDDLRSAIISQLMIYDLRLAIISQLMIYDLRSAIISQLMIYDLRSAIISQLMIYDLRLFIIAEWWFATGNLCPVIASDELQSLQLFHDW